jgi:hypothetical protein
MTALNFCCSPFHPREIPMKNQVVSTWGPMRLEAKVGLPLLVENERSIAVLALKVAIWSRVECVIFMNSDPKDVSILALNHEFTVN